jgi:hypothetical protein
VRHDLEYLDHRGIESAAAVSRKIPNAWLSQSCLQSKTCDQFLRPTPFPPSFPLGRRLEDGAEKRYVRQNSFLFNMRGKFHGKGVSEQAHTPPGETEEGYIQGQLGTDKDL